VAERPELRATAHDAAAPVGLLDMRGMSKSFFGVPVLREVDLDLRAGEVHAILGENGAGKSTLMKILAGAYVPDGGTIRVAGQEVQFGHPKDAQAAGISIIYQEFNLLPERTVAQNIFLGREPMRGPLVDGRAMHTATRQLMAQLGVDQGIPPSRLVKRLSVAQQQTVEIAKALSIAARIVVMDEPTAALSPHETAALFERVRLLVAQGIGVLFISHRLTEIFQIADRVTVLKDGRRVDTVLTGQTSPRQLVRMMVGREIEHYFPPRGTAAEIGDPVVSVRGAGVSGLLHAIDLDLRPGEVLGIAGLAGSGRTELVHAIFGVRPFDVGTMTLEGRPVRMRMPRQAIGRGFGFVTEDRKAEGLVLGLGVRENVLLALRGLGAWLRGRLPRRASVPELAHQVDLRAANMERDVRFLSGGNQQKVVLAKWLATRSKVFLFDEPTRGIDVGAKAGIHELIRELARAGAAVLMISSELPEVIGMSDRILVMRNGTIAGELAAGPTEADIMFLATGEHEAQVA
jgi:ABC-type sugar transport system ATPase subunit